MERPVPARRHHLRIAAHLILAACTGLATAAGAAADATDPYTVAGEKGSGGKLGARLIDAIRAPESVSRSSVSTRGDDTELAQVYLYLSDVSPRTLSSLGALGVDPEIVDAEIRVVQAWVPVARLEEIAALDVVSRIDLPRYGTRREGRVLTEGDGILQADALRALGSTGRGVRVGVISDGADSAASAIASGDLPGSAVVVGLPGSGDEGTAMLEIVHDIAPEARLGFCGGLSTTLAFRLCVRTLANEFQADIIVDDLGFFGEPFFEDGPVADQVRSAARSGVLYTSAAGNSADAHHEAAFRATRDAGLTIAGRSVPEHNFGLAAGGERDASLSLEIPPGGSTRIVLQWNDPFGASGNDYDLLVFNSLGQAIASSIETQDGDDDPFEAVVVDNPFTAPRPIDVFVGRFAGADRRLELYVLDLPGTIEHVVPAGSVFGHPALPDVIAAGAIDAGDPGNDDVNDFSSRGPALIEFPQRVEREKPDVAATDGVSITGAGGFGRPVPGGARFSGTSAAAPHVAGVAALLASFAPGADAATLRDALERGAVDVGPAGRDRASGFGRIDALGAARVLNRPPDGAIVEPAGDLSVRRGQTVPFSATGSDPEGLAVSFLWDFGGGAPSRSEASPADVRFERAGSFVVRLEVTDALGASDPTPATVTVNVTGGGGGGGGCSVAREAGGGSATASLAAVGLLGLMAARRGRHRPRRTRAALALASVVTALAACTSAAAGGAVAPELATAASEGASGSLARDDVARFDEQDRIQTYVHCGADADLENVKAALDARGASVEIVDTELRIVQAWLPVERLDEIAALPGVERVTLPSYGRTR